LIGESLGPYKIIEKLGAGGMGEVYLAEDTRLGRQVAIKVLPSSVQDNPEGLARLEQEARILAKVEHPNVATVYGLERAATQEGSRPLLHLAMQYVEGETLADRIGAGAVPVDEALEISRLRWWIWRRICLNLGLSLACSASARSALSAWMLRLILALSMPTTSWCSCSSRPSAVQRACSNGSLCMVV
jgi:hypothetical protein